MNRYENEKKKKKVYLEFYAYINTKYLVEFWNFQKNNIVIIINI